MKKKLKKISEFRAQIRSRHNTHDILRKEPIKLGFKSVVRFGSTTELMDTVAKGGKRIEINTVEAVKNSSNKLLMKTKFTENNVKTADWCTITQIGDTYYGKSNNTSQSGIILENLQYPIVAKHIFGSRGNGNTLLNTKEELEAWLSGKNLNNYIFEKFYNYNREYRLHVTKDGCFYTCRKMLKSDTPENKRWFRNDSNSSWYLDTNPMFDRPVNWSKIEEECVKALKAVGLDIGACDVRVQSTNNKKGKTRENPEFIIVEINSAPSFGDITAIKYRDELIKLLNYKKQN